MPDFLPNEDGEFNGDEEESHFIQGFHSGMFEAARTLREAANDHKQAAEMGKKILEIQANEMAAAILYGWANGLEINANRALKSLIPAKPNQ